MVHQFRYGVDRLTTSVAIAISNGEYRGYLTEQVLQKVRESSNAVEEIAERELAVYGVNTGFGPLCTTRISASQTHQLQENLLKSHAVETGAFICIKLSKLMLILKAHALAQGFSGIKEHTLRRILWHIDNDIIPAVPEQGSVGASGDLAPLSHLFLPLIGLGKVYYKEKLYLTSELFSELGVSPMALGAKEGLALINGTQFILAHAVMGVAELHQLLSSSLVISAMMLDGLLGSLKPFSKELHHLRPFKGAQYTADVIFSILKDSELITSHAACARVQDPYSLRCIPQVHGASWNAWLHLKELVEVELNSVTDNPVILSNTSCISGGNFHGQPLALPIDYACIAASELGNISDRRIYLSLEGKAPGVPVLLLKETGLNSGFMIVQYTSAALASENKGLCFPASADSIPTSLGQEDHVSMGSIGGRKLLKVIRNVEGILGIELFCAAQALDFHTPLRSGGLIDGVHRFLRKKIPHLYQDQPLQEYMQASIDMVRSGELMTVAKQFSNSELTEAAFHKEFNEF